MKEASFQTATLKYRHLWAPITFALTAVLLTANCGNRLSEGNQESAFSTASATPTPANLTKPVKGSREEQEQREFRPPGSTAALIQYTYEQVVESDGTIPIRRIHPADPVSLQIAKELAAQILPVGERGKLKRAAKGDIGYPGDTGLTEEYEKYAVIYRLKKNNWVSAIKIYTR